MAAPAAPMATALHGTVNAGARAVLYNQCISLSGGGGGGGGQTPIKIVQLLGYKQAHSSSYQVAPTSPIA